MKIEEAIKFFKDFIETLKINGEDKILNNDYCKASTKAIEALEKQIGKKPNNKRFSRNYELAEHNIMEGECPNCDDTVTGNSYGYYCGGCGQAIDWGNE